MKFSASILVLIATVTAPATALLLNDGVSVVDVSLESNSTTLTKRDSLNCKGSSSCSNAQSFKNSCLLASTFIQDIVYTVGGTASGVCSQTCGIFVQNAPGMSGCPGVTGQNLLIGYNDIRNFGCQACGSDIVGNCEITINFVTGC